MKHRLPQTPAKRGMTPGTSRQRLNHRSYSLAETQSQDDEVMDPPGSEERVLSSLLQEPETPKSKASRRVVYADSTDSIIYNNAANLLQPALDNGSQPPASEEPLTPRARERILVDETPSSGLSQPYQPGYGPYDDSIDYGCGGIDGHAQPAFDEEPYEPIPIPIARSSRSVSSMGDLDDDKSLDLPVRPQKQLYEDVSQDEEEETQPVEMATQIIDQPTQVDDQFDGDNSQPAEVWTTNPEEQNLAAGLWSNCPIIEEARRKAQENSKPIEYDFESQEEPSRETFSDARTHITVTTNPPASRDKSPAIAAALPKSDKVPSLSPLSSPAASHQATPASAAKSLKSTPAHRPSGLARTGKTLTPRERIELRRSEREEIIPDSEAEDEQESPNSRTIVAESSEDEDIPLAQSTRPPAKKRKAQASKSNEVNGSARKRRKTTVKKEVASSSDEEKVKVPTTVKKSTKTESVKKATRTPTATASGSKTTQSRKQSARKAAGTLTPADSKACTPSRASEFRPSSSEVFALWREEGFYYHGFIVRALGGDRYEVLFDDNQTDTVHLDQLRYNDLRPGDEVFVDNAPFTIDKVESETVFLGSLSGSAQCGIGLLRIPANTVERTWKDRKVDSGSIVIRNSNTRPEASALVYTSNAKQPLFNGSGFIITKSVSKKSKRSKDDLGLEDLQQIIRSNGGTVIDDWKNVISLEGQYTHGSQNWTLSKEECQYTGQGLKRLFLLSDDHCTKPKFLIALALGVPCVHTDFVRSSVKEGELQEWSDYLLDQGTSIFKTQAIRTSQSVDLNWCMSTGDIENLMDSMVAPKLFRGKNVLCYGFEFIGQDPSRARSSSRRGHTDDSAKDPLATIPPLFIAMGAELVVCAAVQRFVGHDLSFFDYIVVRDTTETSLESCRAKVVSFGWVKNSLILGRLLPSQFETIP